MIYSGADLQCVENNGKNDSIPETNKDLSYKDDDISKDDQKTSRRRASLPGKHDYQENGLHNTPRLPSFMAAIESAEAKLTMRWLHVQELGCTEFAVEYIWSALWILFLEIRASELT